MRVLIDSTYLLPLIGIRVRHLDSRLLLRLKLRHSLLISDVSLFELSAKGAKYVIRGSLESEDVTQGIQSLSMDPDIAKIPYFSTHVLNTSFMLRRKLNDYLDCLILSTAVNEADVLLTEDDLLLRFMDDDANRALLHALNPDFKIINNVQLQKILDDE